MLIPLNKPALVVGYARFWRELVAFADAKLASDLTGTLGEIRRLAAMMTVLAPKSTDGGWRLLVDG